MACIKGGTIDPSDEPLPLEPAKAAPKPSVPNGLYCDEGGCRDLYLPQGFYVPIPKFAKVDCTYYRCNDHIIFSDHLINAAALGSCLQSADGSKAVKLSDSEYSHLQALRKAVTDEENRLALKYGAEENCVIWDGFGGACYGTPRLGSYSYHNQFLIIEKSK